MSALDARELAVEAGGLTVLAGFTLSLRPGDKVGVVGRNGAGKTSLLKVLAGEAPAAAGTVKRRGALGYLRQDPRQHRADDEDTGLGYVLSARSLREMADRLEKLRLSLEERPPRRKRCEVRPTRGTLPSGRWLLGRSGGETDRRRGWSRTVAARPAGARAVRRRASAARADSHPLRRLGPPAARRADEPPRWRREGMADEVPGRVQGGADRRQPRHLVARLLDHEDRSPRSRRGRDLPWNLLRIPRGAPAGRGPLVRPRGSPGDGDQTSQDARRLDARADGEARGRPRRWIRASNA